MPVKTMIGLDWVMGPVRHMQGRAEAPTPALTLSLSNREPKDEANHICARDCALAGLPVMPYRRLPKAVHRQYQVSALMLTYFSDFSTGAAVGRARISMEFHFLLPS